MSKELTPLQALEEIYNVFRKDVWYETVYSKQYEIIKTALRALEILKRNCILAQYPDGSYELAFPIKIQPRDEDVELLKEVLK